MPAPRAEMFADMFTVCRFATGTTQLALPPGEANDTALDGLFAIFLPALRRSRARTWRRGYEF